MCASALNFTVSSLVWGEWVNESKSLILQHKPYTQHTFRHTEIILSNDYQFPHSPIQQNTLNKSVANDHPGAPSSTQAPMATYGIIVPNISDKPNLHSLCKREPSVDILLFNTPTPLKLTHWWIEFLFVSLLFCVFVLLWLNHQSLCVCLYFSFTMTPPLLPTKELPNDSTWLIHQRLRVFVLWWKRR